MIASRDIKNMVVKNRVEKLEKENKQLKKELELVRKNTRANVETLDNMY
jgi:cell division protein FtsB